MSVTKRGVLKAVLLGDSSSGKTSLMIRWTRGSFSSVYRPTVGTDFETKEVQIEDSKFLLQLWDTAGQERYASLGSAFYRGADVVILVFDVTTFNSFTHLGDWMERFFSSTHVETNTEKPFPVVVVGTKCDIIEDGGSILTRKVEEAVAKDWCNARNLPYFDASAKTGKNVNEAMIHAANLAVKRRQTLGLLSSPIINLPPAEALVQFNKQLQKPHEESQKKSFCC